MSKGDIFQRFTPPAIRAVQCAREESRRLKNPTVGTEHLLLGLIREREGIGAQALDRMGVTLGRVQNEIRRQIRTPDDRVAPAQASRTWSAHARRVLEYAVEEAKELNPRFGLPDYVDTEHILLGLLREWEDQATRILLSLGVHPEQVRHEVLRQLGGVSLTRRAAGVPVAVDCRLCVITQARSTSGRTHQQVAAAALVGGARMIQLRDKWLGDRKLLDIASELRLMTWGAKASLIINDRVDLALAVGADGVHLGPEDLPVEAARRLAGESLLIGASVSNLEEALAAAGAGANYLGLGSIFATATKSDAGAPIGLEPIRQIKAAVKLPLLAIGGITRENVAEVIKAGADGAAVISAVVEAENMKGAARELLAAINSARGPRLGKE